MSDVAERQQAFLDGLPRQQRLAFHAGLALVVLGLAYAGFGVVEFEPDAKPDVDGFDVPVARIGALFHGYQQAIDFIEPETPTEALLLDALDGNMNFSAGVIVLMLRVFLGTLTVIAGLIALTVFVERERLLRIILAREAGLPRQHP